MASGAVARVRPLSLVVRWAGLVILAFLLVAALVVLGVPGWAVIVVGVLFTYCSRLVLSR